MERHTAPDECLAEDVIQAFVEGRLPADDVADLEAHARRCSSCGQLLAAALAAVHGTDERPAGVGPRPVVRGDAIGRYIVLGHVGSGGMGDVFAAYDPELDRRIALKLLRAEGEARGAGGRRRLLREAKAIAKLSHPNVVVVHDAGTYDDRVFVAMEFVEGQTMASWLSERPRAQKEILAVFAAAARGLSAAHAAGLVHRDFKPQNVMVGAAGSVRVMDFGLARPIEAEEASEALRPSDNPSVSTQRNDPLTLTGELLGTPLFMAPEQFQGLRTDARTDQFSFCVALYLALHGAHPFRHETLGQLMSDVSAGVVQAPPAKSTVPAWLRRVLARGLAVTPTARWPSMEALLGALERDPAQARRRIVAGGLALAAVVAMAAGVWRVGRRGEPLCQSGAGRLAGSWEANGAGPVHDRVHSAFLATGLGYADETFKRAAAGLDAYASRWLGTYRDACEATHVRREQSAEVLDLRMACLDERLTSLRALVDVLGSADRDTLSHAVDAASALPTLDRCADVRLLRESVEPPRDAATRARVDDIRKRAAVVDALNLTGKYLQALELAHKLVTETRALGYRPLLAELLLRMWSFQEMAVFVREAVKDLEESVWLALASRRDDVAVQSGALLAGAVGYDLARPQEGERWAAFTLAILDRLGPGYDQIRSWVLQSQALIRLHENDLDAALGYARQARAIKERVVPGSPDLANSMNTEADVLFRRGDAERALAVNARALGVYQSAYGEGSPWLAKVLSNRGEYLIAAGRVPEAVASFKDALARWETQLDADHPFLAYALTGLGVAHVKAGRPEEALPVLERALSIRQTHEPDVAIVAETRFALARALWDSGRDRARARRLAEQARDVYDRDHARAKAAQEVTAWLADHPARRVRAPASTLIP